MISFDLYHSIILDTTKIPFNTTNRPLIKKTYKSENYNISLLHQASIDLLNKKKQNVYAALNYLKIGLSYPNYKSIIQEQLLRIQYHPVQEYRTISFEMLIPHISGEMFIDLFLSLIHI